VFFARDGESYQEFLLNKRDSLLAVARLSPGFTAAVLDRWQERENKTALPDFTNPAAAARAWAEQYEQRQRAEQQLALSVPKAEFFDRFVEVQDSLGFRPRAKMFHEGNPSATTRLGGVFRLRYQGFKIIPPFILC